MVVARSFSDAVPARAAAAYALRWLCLLMAISVLAGPVGAQEKSVIPPARAQFHLFLLAGQSNMAGRGKIDAGDNSAHPGVLTLTAGGGWRPATDPLHYDKPYAGAGLGKSFGETVAGAAPGVTVGLIPAACGGSPIAAWRPGVFYDKTNSHPYDDAISRAKRAMQDGVLKAILWHQGESDCSAQDSALYEERLRELIARFRSDLAAPELPFFIGQLGRFPGRPWNDFDRQVDAAQKRVAATMPHVYFIPSEGLVSGDNVHFDTPSLKILGRRFAEQYLQTNNQPGK